MVTTLLAGEAGPGLARENPQFGPKELEDASRSILEGHYPPW
jgi:hypothetical protein